ncbi:MAG: GNAT family N-acetyltransferase [Stappiaceae bacterium]
MICIRRAQPDHHPAIVKIWHTGWQEAHASIVPDGVLAFRTPQYFQLWLSSSTDQFHVALHHDAVVGFVAINGAEVVKLFVAQPAQGTGTASALLSHAEKELVDKGITESTLFCTAGNTRAQRFYERECWILRETFPDTLWLPEDAAGEYVVDTHRYTKRLI